MAFETHTKGHPVIISKSMIGSQQIRVSRQGFS